MKRVKRFGVFQTSKVCAIIYFLVSLVIVIPIGLFISTMGGGSSSLMPFSGMMLLAIPFIYGILGFILTAIACLIYNLIAKWTGGIEVEIETMDQNSMS
ncbi:MAG TPA: hypothetical protein VK590_15500 [Saprospiraceae bacterium]|nr:hypothetical protein [Saprospiraceae bacterium]